ncbi:hypothetical protein HNP84_009339 [Thermocatellispora tengchongensis]|uniref:Uncharacterized protein n=1 Tax=Thermocatellispora tengchongensis TaxID=1073253 RepID=A0A840PKX9_9ACTN|nr:hypothetical protein [Thermocatellispora tengchongensis]MBB5139576.1 hypothetical protein [Thermocatellispora tengchongensis]
MDDSLDEELESASRLGITPARPGTRIRFLRKFREKGEVGGAGKG